MAKKKSFEESLKQLEEIVREMESGDLPLEQALKKYETGIAHAQYCKKILNQTEKKITVLTQGLDGSLEETPLEDQ
ncbi:exodeoxyribonuclease VII small subunit [Desulfospira joergensenii]|uniref:exodeoxyribonuclease VII small subunit n=1 Tax=Desulfospira joergensenii TaxID=53329 RepID=UPI0003B2EEB6|nr:exodeoxyribonuclease VII small subunit [Desulfospira joergensenii]